MPDVQFQGNCAEALRFYARVFEGTNLQMMRYADGPGAPDPWKTGPRIMHGQVTIDEGTFMASDFPTGTDGDRLQGF
jgi:PhnB protein